MALLYCLNQNNKYISVALNFEFNKYVYINTLGNIYNSNPKVIRRRVP